MKLEKSKPWFLLKNQYIVLFKERPGVISEEHCWVCLEGSHLYIESSLLKLVYRVFITWRTGHTEVSY